MERELSSDPSQSLLTQKELAARLKVRRETICRMTSRGLLPVHRIGKLPRYDWNEVLEATKDKTVDEFLRKALRR